MIADRLFAIASPTTIFLGVVGVLVLRSIVYRLHRAYASTLRYVPGPWHTKFVALGLELAEINGSRIYYVQALHKKYGPVVRLAPDEVAISDPAAVSRIHAVGTEFKKRQQPGTALNIFSLSDPKVHRTRQRFYAKAFTDEYIKLNLEPVIGELAGTAVAAIKRDARESKDNAADILQWSRLFSHDVIFHLIYGNSQACGLMATRGSTENALKGVYLHTMIAWARFCFPLFLLGRWLSPLSSRLYSIFRPEVYYEDLFGEDQRQREIASRTLFVQNTKYPKSDGVIDLSADVKLRDVDVAHDITTFRGAGGEAISSTLVYLIWQVLRMPDLQQELEREVASITEPITHAKVAELPVLDAVIYESLRLYGGGATFLPRYAPTDTNLGGYIIPAGTAVTSHTPALHRNPVVWDNPEIFHYKRWLDPSRSKALVQDNFQPFSSGSRACIAIQLSMVKMRLFVAVFFRECAGVGLAPWTTDKSMTFLDRFHIIPRSGRCDVVLQNEKAEVNGNT